MAMTTVMTIGSVASVVERSPKAYEQSGVTGAPRKVRPTPSPFRRNFKRSC